MSKNMPCNLVLMAVLLIQAKPFKIQTMLHSH